MLPLLPHFFTASLTAHPVHYIMSGFQKKIIRHTKRQTTQFEKTEQARAPWSDTAGRFEQSDQEFLKTMINMLKALIEKVGSMQEQMDNISRDENSKKESKRNGGEQKHCNRNEESFDGLNSIRLGKVEERVFELETISVESSKTEKQRENTGKKNETEYPRTVEQLEKV